MIADEEQHVLVGLDRDLMNLRFLEALARVKFLERIEARLRGIDGALDLLLVPDLANGEVAAAVELQRVGRIEDALDLLVADRGILDVAPHPHRMRLESLDGQFGAGRFEGEVVFEKIVVPVHVRHGQDLQQQRVVAHQVRDGGIRIDDQLVGQPGDAMIIQRL